MEYKLIFITIACFVQHVHGGVVADFTVIFDYVASNEIIILQNAIEDIGFISSMQVKPIQLESDDVPGAPLNIVTTALSPTMITVDWDLVSFNSDNLTVVGYTVFYKRILDTDNWMKEATTGTQTTLTLTNLQAFTTYTIRVVAFHQQGNGISSQYIDEKTLEGVPETAPSNFKCVSENPYSISLTWDLLESTKWNGLEKDYTAFFRIYNSGASMKETSFNSGKRSGQVVSLKPFTKYEIFFVARTRMGEGPKAWCVVDTMEGVPDIGPEIIYWELDPNRPSEALVTWEHIPSDRTNGRLTGYKVFYGVTKNGKVEYQYPEMKSFTVDQYTSQVVLKNLSSTQQLKIVVKGMTQVGDGLASTPEFIDTCNCPISIYAAWFENKPYVGKDNSGSVSGIFPDFLNAMINEICKDCIGLKRGNSKKPSTLYWDRSKDGHTPIRDNEKDLKARVRDNIHVHVAMFGRSEIEVFQSDYRFVSVINSPGSAFIIRDPAAELDKTKAMMSSLASCWPAIIIMLVLSMVAGTLVWIAECQTNQEDFPNGNIFKGIYHGSYWAFVSMTTVGYGDKTPRSCCAQIIAIVWNLMGPVINGIVIGSITTSLTSINMEKDPGIYGTKVGAIAQTFEYNLGVRRNAKMNATGIIYTTADQLLDDLENRVIDGVLLDSLVAADKADVMTQRKLKLSKIIAESSGWGIILSSDLLKIEQDIRTYVKSKENEMKELVENRTSGRLTIKTKTESTLDTGLIDPNSETYKNFVYYSLITYFLLCIFGLVFEYAFLRMRKRRIVPFGQQHRTLLEKDVAVMMSNFCLNTTKMIQEKSKTHESEMKRWFWKKGYSFGVDGWFKQKTMKEEYLSKAIRHDAIMEKAFSKDANKENKIQKNRILRVKESGDQGGGSFA